MSNKVSLRVCKDQNNPFFTGTNQVTGEKFRMYRFLILGDNDATSIEQYKADVAQGKYPLHTCNKTGLIIHRSTKPLLGSTGTIYRDKNGKWWIDDAAIQEQLDIAKFYPGLADSISRQIIRNANAPVDIPNKEQQGEPGETELDPFKQ